MKRKNLTFLLLLILISASYASAKNVTLSKTQLMDKIKGAWAGQTIGCTFGGPTEFRYQGCTIADSIKIPWDEHRCKWYFDNSPGLYDDIYMDLTFVEVFEREGLDAPVSSFANAFAHAGYDLWHANQSARYNILSGVMPPASGSWKNNPHANDIDFQIESDFSGIMSPGDAQYGHRLRRPHRPHHELWRRLVWRRVRGSHVRIELHFERHPLHCH